jgi:glycosyltransferase involved in cell wall biosynthesis
MSLPSVSVVMPVYNAEKYLFEAIQSILEQTFTDFEFIIINDGSEDSSLSIIKEFMRFDERIVLVSRENKGLIYSLNEGFRLSKGQYIARMDADDISLPTRFEKQVKELSSNESVGVCGCWAEVFGENINSHLWKMPIENSALKSRLLFSVPFIHPSVMLEKKLIQKYNLQYNSKYKNAEDYKFWLDFSKITSFSNIPEVLVKYRYHSESVSRLADSKNEKNRFTIISRIHNEVLSGIEMQASDDELWLQFIVSSNERINKHGVDLYKLKSLFDRVVECNKNNRLFDGNYLDKEISRKYFVACVLILKKHKKINFKLCLNCYFVKGFFVFMARHFFNRKR